MGQPTLMNSVYSAQAGSKPGEVKHLSSQRNRNRRDSLSSGERNGKSPNLGLARGRGVVGIVHNRN
jgi:hypothetical protein